jgi:DNA-binding transcriptional MocR family regulator
MPEYLPVRKPPIMQDRPMCHRTLAAVVAAGSAGITRSAVAEAVGVSEVTASDKLQRLSKAGLIESKRLGVGKSQAARIYYGAGLMPVEQPVVIPKAKPRTHQAIRAPQGPAIIPAGVTVQVCPSFDGDRWRVTAPAVSRLDPDDCRPWARNVGFPLMPR